MVPGFFCDFQRQSKNNNDSSELYKQKSPIFYEKYQIRHLYRER